MKEDKRVDYVLFSKEKFKIVKTSLYFPYENFTYDQWLKKNEIYIQMRRSLEKDESTQFNYNEYDKYLEEKNTSKYKQIIRYKPYYKVRYDLVARNIILFGALLAGVFIIVRLKQTKEKK